MRLQPKLPDVGVTIFTIMSALANEHGAINLSQGFPDFDPDPGLLALVTRHMQAGHNTGWKIGYCLAPEPLSREFQRVHQFVTFASNTPVQMAYAEFLERKDIYRDLAGFYQEKRDLFLSLIQGSRFRPIECRGTYFQMLDYAAITDEPDTAFSRRMTLEHGVAAIPPSAFYHRRDDHRVLRFCFAKKDDTLRKAAERMCRM